jgi:hypothetical protein
LLFKKGESYHIHALINKPQDYLFDAKIEIDKAYQIVSAANKKKTRFRVVIVDYNPKLNGARYLAKDLIRSNCDYDILF